MHAAVSRGLYRALQALRREPVFRALRELERTQWQPVEQLRQLQLERLRRLVAHACAEVPFYRDSFGALGLGPDDLRSIDDLARFPLLTKRDIRESGDRLHAARGNAAYTVARTSGSTGTPLSLRVSRRSWAYHHANIIRAMAAHGVDYFSKEARIGGQSTESAKRLRSRLLNFVCNRVFLPASDVDDPAVDRFLDRVAAFKPGYVYGYPTAVHRVARHVRDRGRGAALASIRHVICHGEELEPAVRAGIAEVFRCPVVNLYGAGELGIIAFECPAGSMHVPMESVVVECVEPEQSQPDGLPEVVVTDLNNYAMPLIRYRIGDLGRLAEAPCACGRGLPALADVRGKIREIVELGTGAQVHSVVFNSIFKDLLARGGAVDEWQVVQEGPLALTVYIVAGAAFGAADLAYLDRCFRRHFPAEVRIDYRRVGAIARHRSGKFRAFRRG